MNKPYIKKILSYSMVGSLGFTILASLQGCGGGEEQSTQAPASKDQGSISDAANAEQGFFLVIQQTGANPDTYELKEKYPSSEGTRAVLKGLDGTEKVLNEAELKTLAEAEAKRFEAGESQLSQPASAESQGLSLGETILASAAGALIGGMIASKLMGNSNYQQHQQRQNSRAGTTASGSRTAGANTSNTSGANSRTQPKSGFFGNSSNSSSRSSSSSVGG